MRLTAFASTGALLVAIAALVLPAAVAAGSGTGCPAWGNPRDNPGVRFVGLMSAEDGVALSVAQITDAWYQQNGIVEAEFIAERLAFALSLDKNGDGPRARP